MISRRTIELVNDTARIEEVVGDFVALKRRGSSLLGLCPFHNEKTPSFNVTPAKGIFKCFGCGKAGNAVRFIMEHEKLGYPEAIRYLAKKYQINVEEEHQSDEVKQELAERESMLLLNEWVAAYFEEQLWNTEQGQAVGYSYFRERGFTDETIRKFRLGLNPDGWSVLSDAAIQQGYQKEYLTKTGLSIERENGSLIDRFRNRVMFPIQNLSGRVIGFGGRILTNEKKTAKYLNSPESEVYHKSAVLYGIFHARKAIAEKDEVLLVEGYTDVISLHQAGVENVVSSSGTSLTADQVRILRRYTQNVTILYDGDQAGLKASFRGIDMILEQGLNVKIVLFPDGEDPDSFARKNSPLYIRDYIRDEAQNFISFKTSVLSEEAGNDPIRRAGMIREIIASLSLIPDPVIRALYLKECSRTLDMEEQTLLLELNKQLRKLHEKKPFRTEQPPDAPPEDLFADGAEQAEAPFREVQTDTTTAQERDIVRLLVRFANKELIFPELDEAGNKVEHLMRVGDFILSELEADEVRPLDPTFLKFYMLFLESANDVYPTENQLFNHDDQDIATTAINLCTDAHELSEMWQKHHQIYITTEEDVLKKSVHTAVYAYKLRHVQHMLKEAGEALKKMGPGEEDQQIALLEKCMALQQAKMEIARHLSYVFI